MELFVLVDEPAAGLEADRSERTRGVSRLLASVRESQGSAFGERLGIA